MNKDRDEKLMEILSEHENPCLIMDREMTDAELERFIQMVEQEAMLTAPPHLKEKILGESKQLGTKIVKQSRVLSVKMQLLLYGLKISAAVVGAIFLLGVIHIDSSLVTPTEYRTLRGHKVSSQLVTETLNEKSNAVSNALNDFSSSLLNWR